MFGKEFEVLEEFPIIFQPIGKYEIFHAVNKNGILEYEIIDGVFGQPSPANWDTSDYAELMRKKSSNILQKLVDEGKLKLLEE